MVGRVPGCTVPRRALAWSAAARMPGCSVPWRRRGCSVPWRLLRRFWNGVGVPKGLLLMMALAGPALVVPELLPGHGAKPVGPWKIAASWSVGFEAVPGSWSSSFLMPWEPPSWGAFNWLLLRGLLLAVLLQPACGTRLRIAWSSLLPRISIDRSGERER